MSSIATEKLPRSNIDTSANTVANAAHDVVPSQTGQAATSGTANPPLMHAGDAAPGQGRPGWLPQMTFQFQIVSVATVPVQSKPGEASRPDVNVGKTEMLLLATLNFEAQVDLYAIVSR